MKNIGTKTMWLHPFKFKGIKLPQSEMIMLIREKSIVYITNKNKKWGLVIYDWGYVTIKYHVVIRGEVLKQFFFLFKFYALKLNKQKFKTSYEFIKISNIKIQL